MFFALPAAISILAASCGTPYGIYHPVQKGQTLYSISRTYGVDVDEIKKTNRIKDPTTIKEGQKIFIPGASGLKDVKPTVAAQANEKPPRPVKHNGSQKREPQWEMEPPPHDDGKGFMMPINGRLTTNFKEGEHDGIDLAAPEGTPVYCSQNGRVIYSDNRLKGYGNLIIVKHEGDYATVYSHNRKNKVSSGDFVERGQVIAEVGRTGRATGNHLHFEIRYKKKPVDPLKLIGK